MNPFRTIKNYSEMLTKIATFTFFVTVLLFIVLRANVDFMNDFLISVEPDFKIKIMDVEQSVLTILIPLLLAFLSFAIKLHNQIATVFKIRQNFDLNYILIVFVKKLNFDISFDKLKINRRKLMNLIFYKYASSREEDETISRHSIELAMNQWTIFWIIEEAVFFTFITIIILLLNKVFDVAGYLFIATLLGLLTMKYSYKMSIRYSEDQIIEILNEESRKKAIMKVLNEI